MIFYVQARLCAPLWFLSQRYGSRSPQHGGRRKPNLHTLQAYFVHRRQRKNTSNLHTWPPKCIIFFLLGILAPIWILELLMWRLGPRLGGKIFTLRRIIFLIGSISINEAWNHHTWTLYLIFIFWVEIWTPLEGLRTKDGLCRCRNGYGRKIKTKDLM